MNRNDDRRRFSIYFVLLLLLLVIVLWFGLDWLARTAKQIKRDPKPTPVATPAPAAPKTHSYEHLMRAPDDPKGERKLVDAFREYFDLDVDAWVGRAHLVKALEALGDDGEALFKDLPHLRWLIAQSRSLEGRLNDPRVVKRMKSTVVDRAPHGFEILAEGRQGHVRHPNSYLQSDRSLEKHPRRGPWPTVLALHAASDADHESGRATSWLTRNWDPTTHAALYEDWFVCMPFMPADGYTKDEKIQVPGVHYFFRQFWNHYHVDFDRVVLDGSDKALLLACTNGSAFFAGLVLRELDIDSTSRLHEKIVKSLTNIAHVPIYVPNRPDVAAFLARSGCERVTAGDGGASLVAWMQDLRRRTPTRFTWQVRDSDQQLAYWINVDTPDWDAAHRELSVDIESNTIRIDAWGIKELSLFLNDELIDLDAPVTISVNGVSAYDQLVDERDPSYRTRTKDVKITFETRPVNVRRNRFYGWLKSAVLVRLPVPLSAEERASNNAPPVKPKRAKKASAEQEQLAVRLLRKAKNAIAAAYPDRAREHLEAILALPPNAQGAAATALLKQLQK